jgi:hypothetical protein
LICRFYQLAECLRLWDSFIQTCVTLPAYITGRLAQFLSRLQRIRYLDLETSEASAVLTRKFDVGQPVYLRPNLSTRNAAFGVYEIRATLPAEDGQFRYRIKSQLELHERVVKESELSTA